MCNNSWNIWARVTKFGIEVHCGIFYVDQFFMTGWSWPSSPPCPSKCIFGLFVTITHERFEVGSPNLEIIWSMGYSVLTDILGLVDLNLQGYRALKMIVYPLSIRALGYCRTLHRLSVHLFRSSRSCFHPTTHSISRVLFIFGWTIDLKLSMSMNPNDKGVFMFIL